MASVEALQAQVERLAQRVQGLEDAESIRTLKARYAELVDQRFARGRALEPEALDAKAREIAALFAEDAVWDGGKALGVARGRDAIAQRLREPTLQFSWHYFLKPRIEISGDRATARWDILSPCTTPDGRPHWMAGFEDDEYARVGDVWLHQSMKLTAVFMAPHATGWEKIFY